MYTKQRISRPMRAIITWGLACCLLGYGANGASGESSTAATSWRPKSAAAYLDQRVDWWMSWPSAARDQGTFCISCHTAVPYALARPALRSALGESAPSPSERRLLDSVIRRTRSWKEISPFYDDVYGANKAVESRGTEAVLNALVLASYDATRGTISGDSRAAFDNVWVLQRVREDGAGGGFSSIMNL